jgi:hypothetical protein
MSARNFSRALGVPDNNTQNYLGAKPALPKADYLEQILLCFQSVNPEWLLTGKGEPFLSEKPEISTTQTGDFKQVGNTNSQKVKGNKNNVQNNNGDHATITNNIKLEECQRDLEASRKDAAAYQREIALLQGQLKDKEEIITLLRASYNRPN